MAQKKKMNTGSQNALDDLTGKPFGLLTVEERAPNDRFGTVYWFLRCRCNELVIRRANVLRAGKFFTCGKVECRFWEKVSIPEQGDEFCPSPRGWCWEWTGALTGAKDYGVLKIPGQKKNLRAHVFSYEQTHGPLPEGQWALHHCDNRKCVRPSHLFAGTNQDNMTDMAVKGRALGIPRVHLSPTEKNRMRADYQRGGVTQPALAERFGVSLQTVGRILRRGSRKEP